MFFESGFLQSVEVVGSKAIKIASRTTIGPPFKAVVCLVLCPSKPGLATPHTPPMRRSVPSLDHVTGLSSSHFLVDTIQIYDRLATIF